MIAYEPVWAIGTGRNATPEQAGEAHAHIRARLRQWFGGDAADQCHVIYGGSVKPDNIRELMALPDVDGALVGGREPRRPRVRRDRGATAARARYNRRLCSTTWSRRLYVLSCFLLLLVVVLLQQGKGGDMASAFGGGGSQTAFGARAGATVLTKATTILGALFMLGAIALGIIGQRGGADRWAPGVGRAGAGKPRRPRTAAEARRRVGPADPGCRERRSRQGRRERKASVARTLGSGRPPRRPAKVAELADAPA